MKLAEKFSRPIFTFLDLAGAFPGIGAEERGQGEAIARNLFEMSQLHGCRRLRRLPAKAVLAEHLHLPSRTGC